MHRKWILAILTIIDIAALILIFDPLLNLFHNGLQLDSILKIGLIIVITGLINLTYVSH